jgi:hypothetical protein
VGPDGRLAVSFSVMKRLEPRLKVMAVRVVFARKTTLLSRGTPAAKSEISVKHMEHVPNEQKLSPCMLAIVHPTSPPTATHSCAVLPFVIQCRMITRRRLRNAPHVGLDGHLAIGSSVMMMLLDPRLKTMVVRVVFATKTTFQSRATPANSEIFVEHMELVLKEQQKPPCILVVVRPTSH